MEYYLQKIIVLLKHKECEQNAAKMKATVEKQGVEVEIIYISDDKTSADKTPENKTFDLDALNTKTACIDSIEGTCAERENILGEDATLYISDCRAYLTEYIKEELPVLAYFHSYNKEEAFDGLAYGCEEIEQLDADYFDRIYRRCKQLPWTILQTKRCVLRETTEDDIDAFYEIYREPSITKYTENLFSKREQEVEYVRDYRMYVYEFYDFGIWTVLKKETGEIIGRAGLSYREGFELPELGFVIGVPWQRQGFAYEVCQAVMDYGREILGFESFQALVEPGNDVSLRLCRKLGFDLDKDVCLENKTMHLLLKNRYEGKDLQERIHYERA